MINSTLKYHSRRDFLRSAGYSILAASGPVISSPTLINAAQKNRPNILLIMADDMGYSDIGCYGGEIHTPNINRLADNGLRYTQFYNTARCCPTRASLLTGLYPHQAGMGWMTVSNLGHPGYQAELNNKCVTIAEALKTAGYKSYMSGKWHLVYEPHTGPDGPKHNWPMQRGFDRFFGTILGGGSFFSPDSLTRDNTQFTGPRNFYYTDAISDSMCTFISQHQNDHPDRPFFGYVSYTAPHWPLHAKSNDIKKYTRQYLKGWDHVRRLRLERMVKMNIIDENWALTERGGKAWDEIPEPEKALWDKRMAVYAAQIDSMDQGIGRIVETLKKTGQLNNTLIFFLADNGGCAERINKGNKSIEALGSNASFQSYLLEWANASNTPFKLYKHYVHEGGIATPLIVHWPDRIKSTRSLIHTPGHVIDIMPTLADVAEITYPREYKKNTITPLPGKSLVPTFTGAQLKRDALYWEHEGNRAVRAGKWKLVAKGIEGEWELYDMETGRTETNNLASKYPQKVKELSAKWEKWAGASDVFPLDESPWGQRKEKDINYKKSMQGLHQGAADPSIIKAPPGKKGYYVFATGKGLPFYFSSDLRKWKRVGRVFKQHVPAWAKKDIPQSTGIWAPDVSFFNNLYHLYYSVSSFGSQRSCIGLAVNKTLDLNDPDYKWIDQQKVIESFPQKNNFNAIDPAVFIDKDKKTYMIWGSYWTGIKMTELDMSTGKPFKKPRKIIPLASRGKIKNKAIEGAYIIFRKGYYYLFVSWDFCCAGINSTYKVMAGRSEKVIGPYIGLKGRPMNRGGGTLVLGSHGPWRGPGHNSILQDGNDYYMAHHTYDSRDVARGRILQIRPLFWTDEGWPMVGDPFSETDSRRKFIPSMKNISGKWVHSVDYNPDFTYTIDLLPDGSIDNSKTGDQWSIKGSQMTLKWAADSYTSKIWKDKVFIGGNGRYYIGRNQNGQIIYGRNVF